MTYILQRYSDNRDSTLGLLLKILDTVQGPRPVLQAYTLEDEYRGEKVMKETRIPAGTYQVIAQAIDTPKTLAYRGKYPWFKSHLMLKDVPGFIGIYIHVGNDDGDTDGCILLGDIADNNSVSPGSVMKSTESFRRFYEFVYPHLPVTLIVKDEKDLLS